MIITDAKTALAELAAQLTEMTLSGLTYYYLELAAGTAALTLAGVSARLPCYDEYTVGHTEGRAICLLEGVALTNIENWIFKPIVLTRIEIAGTRRPTKQPSYTTTQ